jgi:hypothetical protein
VADLTDKQIAIGNGAAPADPRIYVTCHQCDNCGHIGINDEPPTESACNRGMCGWHGPSPSKDLCPDCGEVGTMSSACPKCGGHYVLLAEANLDASAAPSQDSLQEFCRFPECKCPMDPGPALDWCAKGLPHKTGDQQ